MIVVDTHVLIWDALAPDRLSSAAVQALAEANRGKGMIVADITLWEIAMLLHKGRVRVDTDHHAFLQLILQANRIQVQPITPQIAAVAVQLPAPINFDPADRLIAATALAEGVPLVTADRNLRASAALSTIW